MPDGQTLSDLQWLEITPEFGRYMGSGWPYVVPRYTRKPGLLTLMQNFHDGASFYDGSGLVVPGTLELVYKDTSALVRACRAANVGARYQTLLERTFNPSTLTLLSENKRAGLRLATEVALLKGQIDAREQVALKAVADGHETPTQALFAYPGSLRMLGRPVADAMVMQMRGPEGEDAGVILYLASDPKQALRKYASWALMTEQFTALLRQPDYLAYVSQLIALGERPAFVQKLRTRLKDPSPDLALDGKTHSDDVFAKLVALQVNQAKEDARLLLVPTADADSKAARARLDAWESAGMSLVNLAGLFIPGVGEVLLGQFVVQILSQVCEGAVDWHHGHQHEALEHMLGVAESLAVVAAVGAGASLVAKGFERSAFVDGLEPVQLDAQGQRLWSSDLRPYVSEPDDATLQADGLYGAGPRRWMKVGQHYYEVHRPDPVGPWRLRHPRGDDAFGPVVHSNGERGWWLHGERPLEWDDSVRLLDTLWPHQPALESARAEHIMRVAGVDQDELRGLLVEQRPVPVNLRYTLRRFEADRRINAFFAELQDTATISDDLERTTAVSGDRQILDWCLARPGIQGLRGQKLHQALIEDAASLRGALLDHLTAVPGSNEPLFTLLKRDFPGLPDDYVLSLVEGADDVQLAVARTEARVPLTVAQKASSLLQMARLNRALEGLYLRSSSSDETGELVLSLLRRVPNWPSAANFELRQGSDTGRRISSINPQGDTRTMTVLMLKGGRYRLYDNQGYERDVPVAEPAGLFEAIVALLSAQQLGSMSISSVGAADQLRLRVLEQLPVSRARLLQILGWRAQQPWFNPGQRLPDGRVGYLLSGRGQGSGNARATLRVRIRSLYTGFSDAQVEDYLNQLMRRPGTAFDILLEQEENYAQLRISLNRWVEQQSQPVARSTREQLALRLRRAWRLQGEPVHDGEGNVEGMRLDLSGLPVERLPVVPPTTDFEHVTVLTLANMRLDQVPVDFLRAFSRLRRLNLRSNRLTQVPEGVGYLTDLRVVRLGHNQIRMTAAGFARLAALPELVELDLSYNPLGRLQMRFNHLSRLARLNVSNCRLSEWPTGLELLGYLERADLRDNQLARVPAEILQMPLDFRLTLLVERNRMRARDLMNLRMIEVHPMQHEGVGELAVGGDYTEARRVWLERMPETQRDVLAERWDTLSALPHSSAVFDILSELPRTADFRLGQAYMADHVWALLQTLESDSELREQVFTEVNQPLTCEDSVIDRFAALQVQVRVAVADSDGALGERRTQLLSLGRGLFRLDRLEQFAREDIRARGIEGGSVDEIEVSLFYRVNLADQLQLPFQPRSMRFGRVARVSEEQLQEASRVVLAAQTDEALAEDLSARVFWQRYMHERHLALFDELELPFDQRGTALDEQEATMTSGQYQQQWEAIKVERQAAVNSLTVRLTLEVLAEEQG
ncbi:hypothetical protein KSS93_20430 [Pseudomonas xanthosomatis]|nr:NEL-type E3 ubiquitin ligase domain-containing protein [Pseudomonas xanthosomatis]QXH45221.1 hypothetical protein KSS93_20430 [Pseudomonas xanthosomatis]